MPPTTIKGRKKSSTKQISETKSEKFGDVGGDLSNEYETLAKDIVGDEVTDSDDEDKYKKSGRRKREQEDDDEDKPVPYMLFDFRK